jgi:hypothetical protein
MIRLREAEAHLAVVAIRFRRKAILHQNLADSARGVGNREQERVQIGIADTWTAAAEVIEEFRKQLEPS